MASDLPPHVQRMVDELHELTARTDALGTFIGENPVFETLDSTERLNMQYQFSHMVAYRDVLGTRINNAKARSERDATVVVPAELTDAAREAAHKAALAAATATDEEAK